MQQTITSYPLPRTAPHVPDLRHKRLVGLVLRWPGRNAALFSRDKILDIPDIPWISIWGFPKIVVPPNHQFYIYTLQGTKISHLGKRKIIFKSAIFGEYVSSLEGNIPWISIWQKNYLAMLNHNIWHVTSLLHVQLKYIPLTNEMSRRYQLKFIYLQKCHFLQRPIYLAWECQAAVPSNVPTMSQITSLKSSTSLWTSLLRSLRWRFSDSIGEVELGIENQLVTHVGYCWISIWTLLMLL